MEKARIHASVRPEVDQMIKDRAARERRSYSNMVEVILEDWAQAHELIEAGRTQIDVAAMRGEA